MANETILGGDVVPQMDRFETGAAHMPLAGQKGAAVDQIEDSLLVSRKTKRKGFFRDKVAISREKQLHKRNAKQRELKEALALVSSSPDGASRVQSGTLAHESQYSEKSRTSDEWETIRELQLCSRCLMHTVPPHKMNDSDAPCKDQPMARFDATKISKIRQAITTHFSRDTREKRGRCTKSWHDRKGFDPFGRSGPAGGFRSEKTQHISARELVSGFHNPAMQTLAMMSESGSSSHDFAHPRNQHPHSSPMGYTHRDEYLQYHGQNWSISQQNAIQPAHVAVWSIPAPMADDRPKCVKPEAVGRVSRELEVSNTGPPSSGVDNPEDINIEEDFGPLTDQSNFRVAMPDVESSNSAMKRQETDWDTATAVPSDQGRAKDDLNIATKKLVLWTLEQRDRLVKQLSAKPWARPLIPHTRSSTLPPSWKLSGNSSPSEAEDSNKTVVEETQGTSIKRVCPVEKISHGVALGAASFAVPLA